MLCLALEVVKLLAPYCARIAIAGSIRRGKATVGDIEIVCEPDYQPLPTGSGFLVMKQNGLNWICEALRRDGVFEQRYRLDGNLSAWGDQMKHARYKGVNLDLFMVLPGYSWGREILIRTGP